MPNDGRCRCGAAVYYVRAERVGDPAYFQWRRCGRRYRAAEAGWTPGAPRVIPVRYDVPVILSPTHQRRSDAGHDATCGQLTVDGIAKGRL
jgi:hypothetical protein